MNYYEVQFTYTSPIDTEIINDVLASELGEIGFESFTSNENGLTAYISEKLYDTEASFIPRSGSGYYSYHHHRSEDGFWDRES